MTHGGIVRPDEEIQHKSFPAVSLSICLRVYAAPLVCVRQVARVVVPRSRVRAQPRTATHLTLECVRRLAFERVHATPREYPRPFPPLVFFYDSRKSRHAPSRLLRLSLSLSLRATIRCSSRASALFN